MTTKFLYLTGLISALAISTAFGHDHPGEEITPQHEREHAQNIGEKGPSENKGIRSVNKIGSVDLSSEFPSIGEKLLRAREIIIEPGGVVAVHQHQQRPGVAYILEGEIVEHRNDHSTPLLRKAGDAAFENSGVIHWWENISEKPVKALIVDIVDK